MRRPVLESTSLEETRSLLLTTMNEYTLDRSMDTSITTSIPSSFGEMISANIDTQVSCCIPSSVFFESKFITSWSNLDPLLPPRIPSSTEPFTFCFYQQQQNRTILIDWIEKICMQLSFSGATLSLSVHLLDLLSQTIKSTRIDCRLLALMCVSLASKLHESQDKYLTIDLIEEFFSNKYTKDDIYKCETLVFAQLKFNVRHMTSYEALCSFLAKGVVCFDDVKDLKSQEDKEKLVSKVELKALEVNFKMLFAHEMHCYASGVVAAAIVSCSRTSKGLTPWSDSLKINTGFSQMDIQDCIAIVQQVLSSPTATDESNSTSNTFVVEYNLRLTDALRSPVIRVDRQPVVLASSPLSTSSVSETESDLHQLSSPRKLTQKIKKETRLRSCYTRITDYIKRYLTPTQRRTVARD